VQHYHLLRKLRIAQLYLGLWTENSSDSPSGEGRHVETVIVISVIFFFRRPPGQDPISFGSPRQPKETAVPGHLFCRDDGKAYSDVLWKHFHGSVRFFQAVLFEVGGFF